MKITSDELAHLLANRIARHQAATRLRLEAGSRPDDVESWDQQEGSCLDAYRRYDPYHGERIGEDW